MKLSVVIPAYNEEKRITKALKEVSEYLEDKKIDYEVIVVDDGSGDSTIEKVKSCEDSRVSVIQNERNRGKGYSVRKGMLASRGDYVLLTDADLSTPISELDKFLGLIEEYPVVIASRNLPESNVEVKQNRVRVFLGKTFPALVRLLLIKDIRDTQCGFKLFRKDIIHKIFDKQTIDGFAFDVELLLIAEKQGVKVKEVPVWWRNDVDSRLNIKYHTFRMFADLIKIKVNEIKGKYDFKA